MKKRTIAITGSRIKNYSHINLNPETYNWIKDGEGTVWDTTIIHGGAPGVDTVLAAKIKEVCPGIKEKIVRPTWPKGASQQKIKYSYLERNKTIIDEADYVIAIWNGRSKGTKFTIDYAESQGKEVDLFKGGYNNNDALYSVNKLLIKGYEVSYDFKSHTYRLSVPQLRPGLFAAVHKSLEEILFYILRYKNIYAARRNWPHLADQLVYALDVPSHEEVGNDG